MKIKALIYILTGFFLFSCNDLDLNPLSEGSSESWNANASELDMSVAYLYDIDFWDAELTRTSTSTSLSGYELEWTDRYTDDWTARASLSDITGGTINSQSSFVTIAWKYAYTCIAAANQVIVSLDKAAESVSESKLKEYEAKARFARAAQYARLIFLYGDVPYYTNVLSIEEAFSLSRTDKQTILEAVYADYDFAAEYLPITYGSNELLFPTKGAALAMKSRIALYMGDWSVARDAAKACMDLGVYELHPDYSTLFLSKTKNATENVFAIPRSVGLGIYIPRGGRAKEPITRIAGGFCNGGPSWDLFSAYLCEDGLPIDESPLYNPHEPFKNRDPRCTASIVEFQTPWLGFMYQPHPDSLTVLNFNTGKYQSNADSRGVGQYASYNALTWKKKLDEDWLDLLTDPDNRIIRYADVLMIYAEAKIELGETDQSVLDAMNQVRARAYGVPYTDTSSYPAITGTNQDELRKTLRIERRMEFAFEGLRYADLIRWRLAEKALNTPIYGMLELDDLRERVVKPGLWFFPSTPSIDEDGVADFSGMHQAGQINLLVERQFDPSKQYLWPIPANEILINKNLTQNAGY
ncbi:putative outer membrane starch-binding protein [Dyadobacter jejuensis]|uniref:Putative outer membrane starch-binding protein n=1 Tax=Dyadobacter jejuensis TaxID=1082580 RepID=A0A316A8E9_9BACT|nr:RagB/SusD family nutrient uptake outer membrane protein [Dyadobacter jejuensis]PWJ54061.1 putative outer membrane starch-binding protein [Dyadobacter jejuensis]